MHPSDELAAHRLWSSADLKMPICAHLLQGGWFWAACRTVLPWVVTLV